MARRGQEALPDGQERSVGSTKRPKVVGKGRDALLVGLGGREWLGDPPRGLGEVWRP